MITAALTALLLTSSAVRADDLELDITLASPAGISTRAVTLHEVTPGKQTGLLLELPGGDRYLFEMDLELLVQSQPRNPPQVKMAMALSRLEADSEGLERATIISKPIVITMVNQPATVQQGSTEGDGAGGTRLREGLKIGLLYKTR